MSKRRHLSDLLDANGDVKLTNLDNIDLTNLSASNLTSGSIPDARVPASAVQQHATSYIDWQSVKTANFTAVAGKGYPINTTGGAITMTLPASASLGDTIKAVDYARKWGTNKLTINQNSLKFQGATAPTPEYNTNGQAITLTYIDTTQGWIPTVDDDVTYETPAPTLTNIAGNIGVGTGSNLTLTGTEFGTSGLVVNFLQSSDSIDENVTVTPASTTSAVVAVPANVYNNVTAGNAVTIKVTNSLGAVSGTLNKTAINLPTGGTISTHGSYRVHTFLSSGNYVVPSGFSATHDTLLVAGGGAGGNWHAGGGGAGGMFTYQNTPSAATYAVVVGGGGAGGTSSIGSNGADSTVFSQTAVGGGRGGNYTSQGPSSGGSGGGGNGTTSGLKNGASGTSGQGNSGGNGSGNHGGGGGGGKGATGGNSPNTSTGGTGGAGGDNDYRTGSNVTYAGGGGGGTWGGGSAASGGTGGGGNGSYNSNSSAPTAGATNTGGGGGGSGSQGNNTSYAAQTTGGSGIVVIRYQV